MIASGDFPSQISLGARSVGFLNADIEAWIKSREKKHVSAKTVH